MKGAASTVSTHETDTHETKTDDGSGILGLRPTVVRASAGTGKTYQLTARLLRILLQGAPPESILATTFTRKAAGEILNRLLITLANAGNESDPASWHRLQQQVGLPTLPQSRCRTLLKELVSNVHRLRVSTLDSLFSTLARSMSMELGLPPGWRLTDEIEEEWLRERAINDLIANAESSQLRSLLAMLGGGRVTRSISREIDQTVLATYAKQRLCEGDVWAAVVPTSMPDHPAMSAMAEAFRGSDLPQKSLRAKLSAMSDLVERSMWDEIAEETLITNIATARKTGTEVKFGRSKFPESLSVHLDALYASVKSKVLGLLTGQNEATGSLLAAYEDRIGALKDSQRSMGFDDVAVRLAKAFDRYSDDAEAIDLAGKLDGSIDHLLLDEFQDTSPIQWSVLRPIASRTTQTDELVTTNDADRTTPRSFFCVGDTKQAIYGFRGGVAEIFDTVTDQLEGVETVAQNESYRSSPVVLDFVTGVFQNLPRHRMAQSGGDVSDPATHHAAAILRFAKQFPNHVAARQSLPGYVCLRTATSMDDLGEGATKSDAKAACFARAAERISEIHQQAPRQTIGVLTRSRKAAAEMMWRLDGLGLRVSQEGGNPLTDSAAVDLVLSALMMIEHPGDRRWRFHVLRSPLGRVLFSQHYDTTDADDSDVSEEVFQAVCSEWRMLLSDAGLVETVIELADALVPVCDSSDTLRLQQLVQLATTYQPIASPRLHDFVRLVRRKGVEQPQAAKIRVMTIHASKGLEFDAVVLPELDELLVRPRFGCVVDAPQVDQPPRAITRSVNKKKRHFLSDRWQKAFGRADAADMTEALCLLYVALTRAKHCLDLVIQPTRKRDSSASTPASLIMHALEGLGGRSPGSEESSSPLGDPTAGNAILWESGDPNWYDDGEADPPPEIAIDSRHAVKLVFQPQEPFHSQDLGTDTSP